KGRGDGSRLLLADVFHVGDGIIQVFPVFLLQREGAELFAHSLSGREHDLGKGGVIAEQAGYGGSQSADNGSRKGGQIDDVGGSQQTRLGQAVGKDQATLGVGIVHHNGFAVLGRENVSGKHGGVSRPVF